MYSKNTFTLLLLISSVTTWSFAALGDIAGDRKIVTSKAYVDTKQVKIPATTNTYTYDETNRPTADGSVVTTTTTQGVVSERGIATAPTYDANDNLTNDSWLPTMGAMMNAIDSHTPTGTQNTIANYDENGALGSGIATYNGSGTYAPATDAGKIATAAAVETKQDKITTGRVLFYDDENNANDIYVPALVSYGTGASGTDGILGNKIGILDYQTVDNDIGSLEFYSSAGSYGAEMDNFVPTVRAVAEALQNVQWRSLPWMSIVNGTADNGATQTAAINAYNKTFGSGTNNWAGNNHDLINGQFLANSLALKQNKLPEQDDDLIPGQQFRNDSTGQAASVLAPTTAGNVTQVALWDADYLDGSAWDIDDFAGNDANAIRRSIPTVGAVEVGLSQKQNKITTGNVMFYDDPEGTEGDIYLPGLVAYDPQTSALSGNKIGILDQDTILDHEGNLSLYNSGMGYGSEMDNFVPTVRAVAEGLQNIWNSLEELTWNNTQITAINAYNSTFGNGTNNWAGNGNRLINGYFLANSLALKQNKIPAGTTPQNLYTDGSVLTYTNSAGNVGEKYIINDHMWDDLVTHNVTWTNDYQNMLVNAGDIAYALDYKQNTIPTNHITWYEGSDDPEDDDPYEYVPALVVTDAAGTALNGNTIGIVSYEQIPSSLSSYTGSSNDNFVPTLRVVAKGLSDLNTRISNLNWTALEWSSGIDLSIDRYYTDTNYNHWPAGQNKLINGEFIALALAKKQNKLTPLLTRTESSSGGNAYWKPIGGETIELTPRAYNSYVYSRYITAGGAQPLTVRPGADNVILYVNGTKTIEEFELSNFDYQVNSITRAHVRNALVSLELLKDVYSELNTKIAANSRPTGTLGTVATYNGVTNGVQQFTETAIYDTANAYNATNDANKLATAGFVETKQNKIAAGTAGNVVTYTGTAGSVGSATVSSAADYTGTTLNNGSDIANITAVETKQNKIGATSDGTNNTPNYVYDSSTNPNAAGSVVTTTTTAGTVGQRGIATAPVSDGNGGYSNGDWLPTVDAMMNAISSATPPQPTGTQNTIANYGANGALGSGIATYDGSGTYAPATDAGKIATAAAVETKQDKIVASDILLLEEDGKDIPNDIYAPSIVTHDSNDETLVGTQFGILSNAAIENTDLDWEPPYLYDFADRDDLVPTVAALMPMFDELWNNFDNYGAQWETLNWTDQTGLNSQIGLINSYVSRFGSIGQKPGWPTESQNYLVNHKFLVNALALKQNRIAHSGHYYDALTGALTSYNENASNIVGSWLYPTVKGTGLVTKTSGAGVVGERKIFEASDVANYHATGLNQNQMDIQDISIPTVGAVKSMLASLDPLTWDTAETAAANAYSTTFSDSGTNTWPESDEDMVVNGGALANALSLKQNKITTGLVLFKDQAGTENDVYVPALVATDSTGSTINGNTFGIVGASLIPVGETRMGYLTAKYDNFVPTLRTMARELMVATDRLDTDEQVTLANTLDAINAYSTTFDTTSTHVNGNWPINSADQLINVHAFSHGLALKQNKIPAKANGDPTKIVTYPAYGSAAGAIGELSVDTSTLYTTDDSHVPSSKLVSTSLAGKQDTIPVTSNGSNNTPNYVYNATTNPTAAGSVVTTSGTAGTVGQVGIATAPTYDNSDNLTNGDWLPTMGAVVNAVNSHTPSGTANTIANYGANGALGNGIATYDASGTYTAGTDAGKIATAAAVETKQNKIAAGTSGNVVTYTGTAGSVGSATVSSAATYTNNTLQNGNDIANITAVETKQDKLSGTSGNLVTYGASTGQTGSMAIATTITNDANTVPSTQAVYNAINGATNRFLNYDEAGGMISDYRIKIPKQLTHTGETTLETGDQVFWLPELVRRGDEVAFDLMVEYSHDKLVPTMDELAHALDGVLQTHETTSEWQTAAIYYSINPGRLYQLKDLILSGDNKGVAFNNSGYLQTFTPSLEALMDESYALVQLIDAKQNKLSGTKGYIVTYGASAGETASKAIATTITNDATTVPSTQAVYNAVDAKQDKIAATSDGTNSTPNYVYNSSTNPTAAGSVVTTTTTAGTVSQRGIATAPTRDNNGDLTNENWIPTMGAVESMVSATDVSSNAINGIPLSTGGYFYGTSDTAAATTTKVVSVPNIPSTENTDPPTGLMIIVKPEHTSTAEASSLQLNSFNAKSMRRNGAALTDSTDSYVWNEDYPTVWVYDGTYWQYAGGYDLNTTYTTMTISAGRAGTATTARSISAQNLKAIIHGTKLTDAATSAITFTPTNAAIDASTDTIMSALGKLQGQVSNRVSTTQSTGYQVLTTGTNGTVTADYISVPVTTSGTGRPTSTNAPTGTAAIWIE